MPRPHWDARAAGDLLAWHGLAPGTPIGPLVHDLHDAADLGTTWGDHGVELNHLGPAALGLWCRIPELAREVRRLAGPREGVVAGYAGHPYLVFEWISKFDDTLQLRYYLRWNAPTDLPYLALERFLVPLDALLVHFGLLRPEHLHPLVHAALCTEPASVPPGPPQPPPTLEPFRVRCRDGWHEVRMAGGRLQIPHDEDERRHEATLAALGGTLSGCFATADAWRTGTGRLPRRLRDLRRDLMRRALHGDLDGVTVLLDAGLDPHVRDHRRRTLLHFAAHLRSRPLLDRLLAAGLDPDATDAAGLTPLAAAVHGMADVELIRALLAAGARPGLAVLESGEPVLEWMAKARPADFADLGLA